jgi:hypothetical protein
VALTNFLYQNTELGLAGGLPFQYTGAVVLGSVGGAHKYSLPKHSVRAGRAPSLAVHWGRGAWLGK